MRRQALRLLAGFALISGCAGQGWKQVPLSTGTVPALSTERSVRVTRLDRTVILLENPRVAGDSLIGNVGDPPERVALLLRDVQRLEERSVGGTVSQNASRWAIKETVTIIGSILLVLLLRAVFPPR